MKDFQIICLDHVGKRIKCATIAHTTPRKAKEAGRRVAKLMGLKFHEVKPTTTKLQS